MDTTFENLYLNTINELWACLQVGDSRVFLQDVFFMLNAEENKSASREQIIESKSGDLLRVSQTATAPIMLSNALAQNQRISLIGEPGSGKSTVLQFLGFCFTQSDLAKSDLNITEKYIPVLIKLGTIYDRLKEPESRLFDDAIIPTVHGLISGTTLLETQKLVKGWIERGQLLLLIDGLDEVPDKLRNAIIEKIISFTNSIKIYRSKIVLSSRPVLPNTFLNDFKQFTLIPISPKHDVQIFVERWIKALRPEWDQQLKQRAEALIKDLGKNYALTRLTTNPLLLRLMIEVYCQSEQISRNRVDLYRKYSEETVWQQREAARNYSINDRECALKELESIAWHLQLGLQIPSQEHIEVLLDSGLISLDNTKDKKSFYFTHKTFQQYFVARYLTHLWESEKSHKKVWLIIRSCIYKESWRESLLLTSGMINSREFIFGILRIKPKSLLAKEIEWHVKHNQILAFECLRECSDIDFHTTEIVLTKALRLWAETPYWLQRKQLVDLLKDFGDDAARRVILTELHKHLKKGKLEKRAYAAYAISEVNQINPEITASLLGALFISRIRNVVLLRFRKYGLPYLYFSWTDDAERLRLNSAYCLGELPYLGEEVITSLVKVMETDIRPAVRDQAAESLGKLAQKSSKVIVSWLDKLKEKPYLVTPEDVEAKVSKREIESFRRKHFSSSEPYLGSAFLASQVRYQIKQSYKSNIKLLQTLLLNAECNPEISEILLGKIEEFEPKDPEDFWADTDRTIQQVIAAFLVNGGVESDRLRSLLGNSRYYPDIVSQLLVKRSQHDQRAMAELRLKANEGVLSDAQKIIWEMGQLKEPNTETINTLIGILSGPFNGMQDNAAESLEKIGISSPDVIDALVYALYNSDEPKGSHFVRSACIKALGTLGFGYEQAIDALIFALEQGYTEAIWGLGRIGKNSPKAVEALQKSLKHNHPLVRIASAMGLIFVDQIDNRVIKLVIEVLLSNSEEYQFWRERAAIALGYLNHKATPAAITALAKALGTPDNSRESARYEIWEASSKSLVQLGKFFPKLVAQKLVAILFNPLLRKPGMLNHRISDYAYEALYDVSSTTIDSFDKELSSLDLNESDAWKRKEMPLFLRGSIFVLVTLLLGYSLLISDILTELLKEQWIQNLKLWTIDNPIQILVIFGLIAIIIGSLSFLIDYMKK